MGVSCMSQVLNTAKNTLAYSHILPDANGFHRTDTDKKKAGNLGSTGVSGLVRTDTDNTLVMGSIEQIAVTRMVEPSKKSNF
jgi:hypothetical protein